MKLRQFIHNLDGGPSGRAHIIPLIAGGIAGAFGAGGLTIGTGIAAGAAIQSALSQRRLEKRQKAAQEQYAARMKKRNMHAKAGAIDRRMGASRTTTRNPNFGGGLF